MAVAHGSMRVTKLGVIMTAGAHGSMRAEGGRLGGRKELMRVAIGMLSAAGGEEGAGGYQPEHAASVLAIKCMRMLARIRGYVSTSSYPALRTHARACGHGCGREAGSICKSGSSLRLACAWSGRLGASPVQCHLWRVGGAGRGGGARAGAGSWSMRFINTSPI